MELQNVIEVALAYRNMGNAVQEQLDDIIEGRGDEINPNALHYIEPFLSLVARNGVDTQAVDAEIGRIKREAGISDSGMPY